MKQVVTLFALTGLSVWAAVSPTVVSGVLASHERYNYYVSNTGSDAAAGTESSPWQTVAKVNAAALTAGQSVGFKRGGTWRETLTPPQSGAAGAPITFGAYGSGAQPTLTGANVVSGAWVSDNLATYGAWGSGATDGNASDFDFRNLIPANTFTGDPTSIRIHIVAGVGGPSYVSGAYIGQKATSGNAWDMQAGTIQQFLFSGSGTITLSAGTDVYSDWLTIAYDKTVAYYVSVGESGGTGHVRRYWSNATAAQNYYAQNKSTSAGVASITGGGAAQANFYMVERVEAQGAGLPNVWNKAVANAYQTYFNGTIGNWKTSKVNLAAALDFYTDGTTLSTYATADPSTLYPSIEATARNYVVSVANVNYITVTGLHLTRGYLRGFSSSGTSTNSTLSNSTVDSIGYALLATTPGGYGQAFVAYGANGAAIGNTITNGNGNCISLFSSNALVRGNTVSNCWNGKTYAGGGTGSGIDASGSTGAVIQYNTVSGCYHAIGDGDYVGAQDTLIANNVIYTSVGTNGIDHENGTAGHSAKIYNNTIIHNPSLNGTGHAIVAQVGGDHAIILNNLVYTNFTGTNTDVQAIAFDASFTDINVNNNLYFLVAGSTARTGKLLTTAYQTLSDWKAGIAGTAFVGKDANSINSDPLFTNLSAGDLTLQSGSPAIGAGVVIAGVTPPSNVNIGAR